MEGKMTEEKIEHILHNAPAPVAPAHLRESLERNIELPEKRSRTRRRRTYWLPALSLAASVVLILGLTVLFWSPAPVAYSLDKTLESIRGATSIAFVVKYRYGPAQPLPEGKGTTSFHPANPFLTTQVMRKVKDGREMSYMVRDSGSKIIVNGPLMLTIGGTTGERRFFLNGAAPLSEIDPDAWFLDLQEQAARGELDFEIADAVNTEGNLEIIIRQRTMEEHEFLRLSVNTESYLPVGMQLVSTAFPDHGPEVVMVEFGDCEFVELDDSLFTIEPTDEELAQYGLVREDLADLPLSTTAIEISGKADSRVFGEISDASGKREIAGLLPMMLVEAPVGDMFIDLRTESGESEPFTVRIGGNELMTKSERIVVFLSKVGSTRGISAVPPDVEDIEAFMKR